MAALATAQNMLDRYDEVTIGSLISTTGSHVPFASWATNARMIAALESATGEVMSRLARAERYSRTQLTTGLTDESAAFLVDIVCRVAFWKLWKSKPWGDSHDQLRRELREEYEQTLKDLGNGSIIFELDAAEEAGLPTAAAGTTSVAATRCKSFRTELGRGNFFPTTESTKIRDC